MHHRTAPPREAAAASRQQNLSFPLQQFLGSKQVHPPSKIWARGRECGAAKGAIFYPCTPSPAALDVRMPGNVPLRLLVFDRNKLLLLLRGALDRGGCGGGGGGDDDGSGVGIGRGGHCSRSAAELAGAPSGGPIPHPHLENRVSYADVAVGCLGAAVGGSRWWQPLVAASSKSVSWRSWLPPTLVWSGRNPCSWLGYSSDTALIQRLQAVPPSAGDARKCVNKCR